MINKCSEDNTGPAARSEINQCFLTMMLIKIEDFCQRGYKWRKTILSVKLINTKRDSVSVTPGLGSSLVVVMETSNSCPHLAMPHVMRLCCQEKGCALNPSKSTSMISMVCVICWAPPCRSHTPHSPPVLWTLFR